MVNPPDTLADLRRANAELAAARRAALNLMEDAILARDAVRANEARLARELEDTILLQRVSGLLITDESDGGLAEPILDAAVALMRADFGSIQSFDADRGELRLLAWRNFHPDSAAYWRVVTVGTGTTCGSALRHGGRVVVPDVEAEGPLRGTESLRHYRLSGIRAVQSTPLTTRGGRLIGMISTHWREAHTPGVRELRLLDILARQAADYFERRGSQAALRASEEKYRTLFESIDEGFCILEILYDEGGEARDCRYVQVNPAFLKQTGQDDPTGKLGSQYAPASAPMWLATYDAIVRSGDPIRFERFHPDSGRWYSVYASVIGERGSRLVASVFTDITERKRREEQQAFLLGLSDSLRPLTDPEEITTTAARVLGEQLRVNRAFYAGVDREDWLLVPGYETGVVPLPSGRYPIAVYGQWLLDLMRAGERLVVRATGTDPRYTPAQREATRAFQVASEAAVPLVKAGELVAVFVLHSAIPRDWSEHELGLLAETAERTWAALEQARAEAALAAEREYAHSIVETLHEPVLVLHPDLTVRSVNPAFYTHFRVNPAETVGRKVYDLGNGQWNIPALRTLLEDVLPDSNVFNDYEVTHEFETLGRLVMLVNGRRLDYVQLILLGIRDITERKRAEDALRRSEERLRLALVAARMGIWTLDLETGTQTRGPNLNRLLGREPVETAQPFAEFLTHIHPDDRAAVEAAFAASREESRPLGLEFRVVRPDGSVRWLRDQGDVFGTPAGGRHMAGACVDVTERRAAEDAVRASEDRLRLIVESVTDYAIFTLDPGLRVTTWNTGAGVVFGYAADEMVGQSGDVLFTPEDRAAGVPADEAETARRDGRAADERWHLRKDGSRFFASGVLTPLGPGGSGGFVKVLRDLTDRKLLADERERSRAELEERVRERTGQLAHALDSLQSEMARRGDLARRLATAQEDERRRVARDLHDSVGQLLAGLALAFKAVQTSGHLPPAVAGKLAEAQRVADAVGKEVHALAVRLRPTSLDDLGLEAALGQLVAEWSGRTGVKADFQAAGVVRLPAEVETAVYRVVQEALTNAARHARATQVSVTVSRSGGAVLAVVEDDGAGFDPAAVPKGRLGLMGMRERAALVGGGLDIESAPGGGATVVLRIPVPGEGGGP